jgi:hypothetical protein
VTLFALDSSNKANKLTYWDDSFDPSSFKYHGGFRFVNDSGVPITKHFKSFQLDSAQISRLEYFLIQQPCNDSVIAAQVIQKQNIALLNVLDVKKM